MSIYFVYQLVDPQTNIPFYVGKGKNDRAKAHLWGQARTNNPRKDKKIEEIRRAGQEPIVQYLHENLTEEEAYSKEEDLIAKHGRVGFDVNGILTNIKKDAKPPSQKGKKRTFTDEHRKKLSESLTGKAKTSAPWNKGLTKDTDARIAKLSTSRSKVGNSHQIGIKHSQERIEKVKKKLTGRTMSDDQKTKMSAAKKGKTWEEIYGVDGAKLRRDRRSKK
jgi:hypothetical protein